MRILLALALTLIICGCVADKQKAGSGIVCNRPYILVGAECCLDRGGNGICDRDETSTTQRQTTTTQEPPVPTIAAAQASTTLPSTTTTTWQSTTTTGQSTTTTTQTSTTITTTTTSTLPLPCTDSDGGIDSYTKGIAQHGAETLTDRCLDTASLMEFFCRPSKQISSQIITCPKGCQDGRCLGCTDSDGGDNPDVYGEVTLGTSLYKKDLCSKIGAGTILQEYYCINQTDIGSSMVNCTAGCADGKCL